MRSLPSARNAAARRTRSCGVLAGGVAAWLLAASAAAAEDPGARADSSLGFVWRPPARSSGELEPTRVFLRADRVRHASLSFALASGAGLAGASRGQAFAISIGLGVGKEARDARKDRFDWVDLGADLVGAALGALVSTRR